MAKQRTCPKCGAKVVLSQYGTWVHQGPCGRGFRVRIRRWSVLW